MRASLFGLWDFFELANKLAAASKEGVTFILSAHADTNRHGRGTLELREKAPIAEGLGAFGNHGDDRR